MSTIPTNDKVTAFNAIAEEVKVDVLTQTQAQDNITKREEISRNFVSDTMTVPTEEMFSYASRASLGNDGYFEPSTAALEAHLAKLTGKEAGLFVTSGTAGNMIAIRSHLKTPPHSVLCDYRSDLHLYECGGIAYHTGAAAIAVMPKNNHHLTVQDVKENIIPDDDIHTPPTELVALENTLNGTIFPQEEIIAIADYVHSLGLKLHIDGARLWHVAAEKNISLKDLCAPADSVSMCFTKGLGAPVGSCLVGSKEFIAKARRVRKPFGGGSRQTGFLAACAAYALTHNFRRLPRVHTLAKKVQVRLEEIGARIVTPAETCQVWFDPSPLGVTHAEIAERCSALSAPLHLGGSRLVIHLQISATAVEDLLRIIQDLAEEKRKAGWIKPQEEEVQADKHVGKI